MKTRQTTLEELVSIIAGPTARLASGPEKALILASQRVALHGDARDVLARVDPDVDTAVAEVARRYLVGSAPVLAYQVGEDYRDTIRAIVADDGRELTLHIWRHGWLLDPTEGEDR